MNKEEMSHAQATRIDSEVLWDETLDRLGRYIHDWAVDKGFWAKPRNDGEMIALMHSELSEALEAIREVQPELGGYHGSQPSKHVPEITALEEEMADTIIRILDFSYAKGLRIGRAVRMKMAFNEGRPHKHGKEF